MQGRRGVGVVSGCARFPRVERGPDQRALNAATPGTDLPITGVFAQMTDSALRAWQVSTRRKALGVVNPSTWKSLAAGTRAD